MLGLLAGTAALAILGGFVAIAAIVGDLPAAQDLAKDPLPQSTKVYDRTGQQILYQFEEERRDVVKYEQIPKVLVDATIASEDKSFWTNPGIDIRGIGRAVVADITNAETGQGGASTITQQLVKQRIVGGETTLVRKIREAILSIEVTQTYAKKEILELYFNQIFYGNQAYGVKAAAATYFGKDDLSKLTIAEAALLAGLPQSPSVLDPTQSANLERAKARRAYVLGEMESEGFITPAQQAAANAEAIVTIPPRITKITAPHFVFQVRNQLTTILGGDQSAVTRGGFKVTTTLDMPKQQSAELQVRAWVDDLHDRNVWNAALVSIDPTNGEVVSYVGSVDYTNRDDPRVQGQFDVAGIGVRQPGSSFKMFNYLTALKKGATAATVVTDARTDFGGRADPGSLLGSGRVASCGYCPENADLQYHGPVTMRQAIRESRNVPAVKFLAQYAGIQDTIKTAHDMGITTSINPDEVGLSLTLGSREVKLLDMTSAYGVLANMGVRIAPTFILKVEDARGKVIWEHKDYEQKRVVEAGVAWIMTDILKDTTQPSRNFIFGQWTNIGRPAALKTGTTDNLKDVYSVGFVPQLVTGVWMGNSDGEPMSSRDFSSAMGPGQLWRDYMRDVLEGVPIKDWDRPSNVVGVAVVAAPGAAGGYGSGLLPSGLSPFSMNEWFVKGTEPRRVDDWYTEGCPTGDGTRSVAMRIRDDGQPSWQRYTDAWVASANAGKQGYGRYSWNLVPSTGCVAPSPTPVPSQSLLPGETPYVVLPPGVTLPPGLIFPGVRTATPSPSFRPSPSASPSGAPRPSPSPTRTP